MSKWNIVGNFPEVESIEKSTFFAKFIISKIEKGGIRSSQKNLNSNSDPNCTNNYNISKLQLDIKEAKKMINTNLQNGFGLITSITKENMAKKLKNWNMI